jgi:hypothetical protein
MRVPDRALAKQHSLYRYRVYGIQPPSRIALCLREAHSPMLAEVELKAVAAASLFSKVTRDCAWARGVSAVLGWSRPNPISAPN